MSRFVYQPEIVKVETPDFGVIEIRPLSAAEYVEISVRAQGDDWQANFDSASRMIAKSMVNTGESEEELLAAIRTWPARDYNPMADAVMELNGLKKRMESLKPSGSSMNSPSDLSALTLDGLPAK